MGELSLDGSVRPVRGVLPIALHARRAGLRAAARAGRECRRGRVVAGVEVIAIATLHDAVEYLNGEREIAPAPPDASPAARPPPDRDGLDFADVRGHAHAKRGLEIAAAGAHNVLMIGPPGTGKTMLARRVASILPPLSLEEAIEASTVWSVAGLLVARVTACSPRARSAARTTPPRRPASSAAAASRIPARSASPTTACCSSTSCPSSPPRVLEALRQPLEDARVVVSRAAGTVAFPARFQLVAAANPCRRGCASLPDLRAARPPERVRYLGRLSRPLLDRIDLHLEIPALSHAELTAGAAGEPSAAIRARVVAARARQVARFAGTAIHANARMSGRQTRRVCALPPDAARLLGLAVTRLGLSARAHDRLLRVARTIADLAAADAIATEHVAEAIQYRTLDRAR